MHPFMEKLFAKEVSFGIPPPPFGEESARKNLTDFLWFPKKIIEFQSILSNLLFVDTDSLL